MMGNSMDEEMASEDNLPCRSRRKALIIVREEHTNREIKIGSQQMIFKMIRDPKQQKASRSNIPPKGGPPKSNVK
jgi:hypothetical protein